MKINKVTIGKDLGGVKTIATTQTVPASSARASRHMPITQPWQSMAFQLVSQCVPSAIYDLNVETLTRSS